MGKFDGVLLATDFDDTFCPDTVVVPPANLEAVEYFKAQGGVFTIATGRAHRTFAPQLYQAPVNAPVILSNGAQLYDFEKDEMNWWWTSPFPPPLSPTFWRCWSIVLRWGWKGTTGTGCICGTPTTGSTIT